MVRLQKKKRENDREGKKDCKYHIYIEIIESWIHGKGGERKRQLSHRDEEMNMPEILSLNLVYLTPRDIPGLNFACIKPINGFAHLNITF